MQKTEHVKYTDARGVEDLAKFIPGGLFRCLWDEPLTLLETSEGFLRMLGYTRGEIAELYGDSFRRMIDPRDFERTAREVDRQMSAGTEKELEYRMRRRNGDIIWVLDKGNLVRADDGIASFYCLLVDITGTKQVQEELRLSLERHKIILNQTNDIIVEWDIQEDRLSYSSNWQKKFGYEPLKEHMRRDLSVASHIHSDDIPAFARMLDRLRDGTPYAEVEIRLKKTGDVYLWCRMRFTDQFDECGRAIKAVGVIIDIDEDKRQAQELMKMAEKDALTGLYNKGTAQAQIVKALETAGGDTVSALLIIDIDNFKTVNDTMGHLFGDEFLVGISRELSRLFRPCDIVGRIGGDEFIAYMHTLPQISVAVQRAQQILSIFHRESEKAGLPDSVSCSIGIAMAPRHGRDFSVLFRAADITLYRAKQQGKNRCLIYDEMGMEGFLTRAGREFPTAVNATIDSNEKNGDTRSLSEIQVLRTLYKNADPEKSIPEILEMAGSQCNVSRAYVYEFSEDEKRLCNTFEWCGDGVEKLSENLRNLSLSEEPGKSCVGAFNEDGIFYCRDISALPPAHKEALTSQKVRSVLQCAVLDRGKLKGFVGFDECRINRYWNQSQIDALLLVSEIVGTFLFRQRTRERAERAARDLRLLLENQDSWVYVIRRETYEILYVNRSTMEIDSGVEIGMRCHEVYFGRNAPCERCPARIVEQGRPHCTMQIFNPRYQVWSSADAKRISWRGEDAILLTCHDITEWIDPAKTAAAEM